MESTTRVPRSWRWKPTVAGGKTILANSGKVVITSTGFEDFFLFKVAIFKSSMFD